MASEVATAVKIGHGSYLARESATGSGSYVELAEVRRISFKRGAKMIEVTHLLSPGGYEEYIDGMKNGGELELDLNWLPVATTQGATSGLADDLETNPQPARNYKLYVNGITNPWTFSAKITAYDADIEPGKENSLKLSLRVIGAVVNPTS